MPDDMHTRYATTLLLFGSLLGCSPTLPLPTAPDDAGPPADASTPEEFPPEMPPLETPPPEMPPPEMPPPSGDDCARLVAVVRDFDVSHPDFEDENPGLTLGLVRPALDDERTPVYAHGDAPHGGIADESSFRQWYRDVSGVNRAFEVVLPLTPVGDGHFAYDDDYFFPIDGVGYGSSGTDDRGVEHNFHFTTAIHTAFRYRGGEVFTFRGDDDVWVFVDGRLALDLGGTHLPTEGTVAMDELGLTVGQEYRLDLFHAERHTWLSSFRVETTIDCFVEPELI